MLRNIVRIAAAAVIGIVGLSLALAATLLVLSVPFLPFDVQISIMTGVLVVGGALALTIATLGPFYLLFPPAAKAVPAAPAAPV